MNLDHALQVVRLLFLCPRAQVDEVLFSFLVKVLAPEACIV